MNMNTGYSFYFDETYHDKCINLNSNSLNILQDNLLDDYIGLFWGARDINIPDIEASLTKFEEFYKSKLSLSPDKELKSGNFSNKKFTYGIHSFNRLMLNFYNDLFDLCNNKNLILHINISSKMEVLVKTLFYNKNWFTEQSINYESFVYTFTKMLIFYNHSDLIKELYNIDKNTPVDRLEILKKTVYAAMNAGKNIPRKVLEVNIYQDLLNVLNTPGLPISTEKHKQWKYSFNFIGLNNLLKEISINKKRVQVFIDNEENTVKEAGKYGYKSVEGVVSSQSILIRFSDLLVGFIGKMIWNLVHDSASVEDKITDIESIGKHDFRRIRNISEQWFKLTEEEFNCYKKAMSCFVLNQPHRWARCNQIFMDHAKLFFSLLQYIDQYNFEDFRKLSLEDHRKKYLDLCIKNIGAEFDKFKSLPL